MRFFCEGKGLSLCPHTHALRRGDQDMLVFCFAQRQHAEQFRNRFDAEFIDPKSRHAWPDAPAVSKPAVRSTLVDALIQLLPSQQVVAAKPL
jgi:hypothetical protein